MRGILSLDKLPSRQEANLALKRFMALFGKHDQGTKLPPPAQQVNVQARERSFGFEVHYLCREAGEITREKGYIVSGDPEEILLSREESPPNLEDGQLNKNMVTGLRRSVKGEVFDQTVKRYSFAGFIPSPFFFLQINYRPETSWLREMSVSMSGRWTFQPFILDGRGKLLGFPVNLAEGLEAHPFYTPTLAEWGNP
ncbi:MAG: hypothetical protein PHH60_03750, partial [Candidatus Margulisbacteria bacterium]|nr:hypothetical protein [Candidatus Margulisiibacteriota bacterium]